MGVPGWLPSRHVGEAWGGRLGTCWRTAPLCSLEAEALLHRDFSVKNVHCLPEKGLAMGRFQLEGGSATPRVQMWLQNSAPRPLSPWIRATDHPWALRASRLSRGHRARDGMGAQEGGGSRQRGP